MNSTRSIFWLVLAAILPFGIPLRGEAFMSFDKFLEGPEYGGEWEKKMIEDFSEALEEDARRGDANACYQLGYLYRYSMKHRPWALRMRTAFYWFEQALLYEDHAGASYELGAGYLEGIWNRPDRVQALRYLGQAMSLGSGDATVALARYWEETDKEKSKELWVKAAESGHALAMYEVGKELSVSRERSNEDLIRAADYLMEAHRKGIDEAFPYLAYTVSIRAGAEPNRKALVAYAADVLKFVENTPDLLGQRIFVPGQGMVSDPRYLVEYYRKLSESGSGQSSFFLACHYLEGSGVPQDSLKAMRLFELSAQQGFVSGNYALSWVYFNGVGVRKNLVYGLKYFQDAMSHGHPQFVMGNGVSPIQILDGLQISSSAASRLGEK